jgi:hypothetical protein
MPTARSICVTAGSYEAPAVNHLNGGARQAVASATPGLSSNRVNGSNIQDRANTHEWL